MIFKVGVVQSAWFLCGFPQWFFTYLARVATSLCHRTLTFPKVVNLWLDLMPHPRNHHVSFVRPRLPQVSGHRAKLILALLVLEEDAPGLAHVLARDLGLACHPHPKIGPVDKHHCGVLGGLEVARVLRIQFTAELVRQECGFDKPLAGFPLQVHTLLLISTAMGFTQMLPLLTQRCLVLENRPLNVNWKLHGPIQKGSTEMCIIYS